MATEEGADRTPVADADVCIVGAGVAGGLVGHRLAAAGFDVVFLEAGEQFDPDDRLDQMETAIRPEHNATDVWDMGGPRDRFSASGGSADYALNERRVKGVGGTTLHWLGTTPRLHPRDFELNSRYGRGADWPIDYDDLQPYYAAAERALGVAGADAGSGPPREASYPMDAFPKTHSDGLFEAACESLGYSIRPCPQARNTEDYDGRSECVGYSTCIPVCPSGAKYSGDHHVRKAADAGAQVIDRATVEELEHDDAGEAVVAAHYVTPEGKRHRQAATQFVLAGGGVEIPRLLLLSDSPQYSDGLANTSGAVGRYFMEHPAVRTTATLDQQTNPEPIRFLTRISREFYDREDAGAILLKFSQSSPPSPVEGALTGGELASVDDARDAVLGARWGDDLLEGLPTGNQRIWIGANLEMLPRWENRVGLDRDKTDAFGNPVPEIHFDVGEFGTQTARDALAVNREILTEAGGTVTGETDPTDPNFLSHHMGTTRMGTDPGESVVDASLRTHDLRNCWVVSSSVFPTCGAANPTLTIAALALRASDDLIATLANSG